jgi:hypothetical protein
MTIRISWPQTTRSKACFVFSRTQRQIPRLSWPSCASNRQVMSVTARGAQRNAKRAVFLVLFLELYNAVFQRWGAIFSINGQSRGHQRKDVHKIRDLLVSSSSNLVEILATHSRAILYCSSCPLPGLLSCKINGSRAP